MQNEQVNATWGLQNGVLIVFKINKRDTSDFNWSKLQIKTMIQLLVETFWSKNYEILKITSILGRDTKRGLSRTITC